MKRLPAGPLLTLLALAAALLAVAHDGHRDTRAGHGPAPVGAAVEQRVAQEGKARIIVSLREPAALRGQRLDIAAVQTSVAATQQRVLEAVSPSDFSITHRYQSVPALAGTVTPEGLEALAAHPDVVAITADGVGEAALSQSGALVHAPEVHDTGLTGAGVVVAVLDTGIDTDHPDLADSIAYEACFLLGDDCPPESDPHPAEDDHGHGTNVSGIITSNGTVAPKGVAPDAQIAAYKILNDGGSGFFSDWTAALDDIIADHPEVDIVNMSLQSSGSDCPRPAMGAAISILRKQRVPVFIASGNHGLKNTFFVPACIEEGISVGATYDSDQGSFTWPKGGGCTDPMTTADQVACWSDSQDSLDLVGPGAITTSTGHTGGTSSYRGTSQASPHAVGIAALMLEASPELTVDEIEQRLEATGRLVVDDLHDDDDNTNRTTPRVDARVALLAEGDDYDGDGCSNEREWGNDPSAGGRRNPLDPWDVYDVTGDGTVNMIDDVLAVAAAFGPDTGQNYDPALDRSPAPPDSDPWRLGPPDGTITIADDILGVIAQFGHSCAT